MTSYFLNVINHQHLELQLMKSKVMILAIQVSSGFHVNQETLFIVNLMKKMIVLLSDVRVLCSFQMPIARANHCANRNQTEIKGVVPAEKAGHFS